MHPRQVLLGAAAAAGAIPVCDHYSGVESRMVKSLSLQAQMMEEFGACVFDVSLDCEDGAPVGKEQAHAHMVVALANQSFNRHAAVKPRIAARVHPVDHDAFESDVAIIVISKPLRAPGRDAGINSRRPQTMSFSPESEVPPP